MISPWIAKKAKFLVTPENSRIRNKSKRGRKLQFITIELRPRESVHGPIDVSIKTNAENDWVMMESLGMTQWYWKACPRCCVC